MAAALVLLLYRYGARDEVTFGHGSVGSPGEAPLPLGPCGHPAVLRIVAADESSFEQILEATAECIDHAARNADISFQEVARALNSTQERGGAPLYQVLFESELELAGTEELLRGPLRGEDLPAPACYLDCDVRLTARQTTAGLALDWSFDAELHDSSYMATVAEHYVRLLSSALEQPTVPITRLDFLSAEDRSAIESYWNRDRKPYPRVLLHRLIEEQARRNPETVAIEFGAEQVVYADFNRRCNRLARYLRSCGVGSGDMVGLCLDRSVDSVVGVVALLKAGCVVVPLDAAYPQHRLRFMIRDAGLRAAVTNRRLLSQQPRLAGALADLRLITLDAERAEIDRQQDDDLPEELPADALAYCIYTSGSTGRPKGVLVDHRALVNLVSWHERAWLTGVGVRTLLYSPTSFDVSFHELAAGLSTGATLVQVDDETRVNPIALIKYAREKRIEKWYMPFVALQQMAQAARTSEPPGSLKELIVGGEILRVTPEIREFARRTGCVIRNHYGSTECIDVATYSLSGDPDEWPSVVPIGRANVDNMNLYILDGQRKPVPVGVVGELYADGDSLARGYHNQPELTAERFGLNPFGAQGPVLYRLGDLGRYLPDGTIECLGRTDSQVKVRGFRVEPSEIEVILAQQPSVAECAVTTVQDAGRTKLVAHVVPRADYPARELPEIWRAALAEHLPAYMIPSSFEVRESLPLTPSGKLDTRALRVASPKTAPRVRRAEVGRAAEAAARIWRELLDVPELRDDRTFFELGGDSILIVQAHQRLEAELGRDLPAVTMFRYPTIHALAGFLDGTDAEQARSTGPEGYPPARAEEDDSGEPTGTRDIAVVGMACRVPGAADIGEFWSNLLEGTESITALPADAITVLEKDQRQDSHFVPAVAAIPDIDRFDAEFFGYSAAEAATIDPQHRTFLECAWSALEDAGLDVTGNTVGVYAGSSLSTYLVNNVLPTKLKGRTFLSHRHFDEATDLRIEQGNAGDHLPTRVSFKLDLRGPSVNVQSTCSTSLVAVHLARQALLRGECDVALAGGVAIITPQETGYLWRDGMMLSPDGHCRAFDARAAGTVFGNGLGVVVLKPLSSAIADGDAVYAVIKGSAVNNDGAGKLDYAGPNVEAQTEVICAAHRDAGVSADEISYVEAHGTGTKLGDPIEIAGLREAFRRTARAEHGGCLLGSVKTNIGHLDEAAGVIGLIKTVLSLHHREIPATLHFTTPNPLAELDDSPFTVSAERQTWHSPANQPRRAGVSSFGMGGTNCHVVLEEAPARTPPQTWPDNPAKQVLTASGRTAQALHDNLRRYEQHLSGPQEDDFSDICFTAATGRRHFRHRAAVLASDAPEARTRIAAVLEARDGMAPGPVQGPSTAFLFTGQGSQYFGMGRELYESQPVYRAAVEECDALLRPLLGHSILPALGGAPGTDQPEWSVDDTGIAQPALFTVEYALSRLWDSWGIRPSLLIGHSLGEVAAACVAGVFDLADGLRLVTARGRLMQDLPRTGAMAQVYADADRVRRAVDPWSGELSVASFNSADITVISGSTRAVDAICRELEHEDISSIRLNVSHAFHSPLMTPMLNAFRTAAESIPYGTPETEIIANVTGAPAQSGDLESADYWVRHITQPVYFAQSMAAARDRGIDTFVEIGPNRR